MALPFASPLQAATIVNWDGGIGGQVYQAGAPTSQTFAGSPLSGNVNYAGGAATDRQQIRPYSASTTFSPASPYPNSIDTNTYSAVFYGGYESLVLDSASGTALGSAGVRTGTAASGPEGSIIRTTASRPIGSNYVFTAMVLFQKADFLNGFDTGSLTLDSISMTLVAPSVTTGTLSNMRGRWLLMNGSTIYMSQDTFSMDAGVRGISDFSTSLWAVYTPSTAGGTVLNFQPSSFSAIDFDNVQGVGFYSETWDGTDQIIAGTGNTNAAFNISDFAVNAVPEPSSVALTMVGGLLCFFRRHGSKRP